MLNFGLGALSCDYAVEVRWPDGKKEAYTRAQVPQNTVTRIKYGVGVVEGK